MNENGRRHDAVVEFVHDPGDEGIALLAGVSHGRAISGEI